MSLASWWGAALHLRSPWSLSPSLSIPVYSRTRISRDWNKVFLFSRETEDCKHLFVYIGELWSDRKTCMAVLNTGDQGTILPVSLISWVIHFLLISVSNDPQQRKESDMASCYGSFGPIQHSEFVASTHVCNKKSLPVICHFLRARGILPNHKKLHVEKF